MNFDLEDEEAREVHLFVNDVMDGFLDLETIVTRLNRMSQPTLVAIATILAASIDVVHDKETTH